MSRICSATKRNGEACTLPAYGSSDLCWAHASETAERRRKGQSRGGKSRPSREIIEIKASLRAMIDEVNAGTMDRGDAAVSGQLYNTLLRALSTELKIKEQEELVERMERLEQTLEANRKSRFGAS